VTFEEDDPDEGKDDVLLVSQGAYEGPLALLLDLVKSRKVDVTAISILAVVDDFFAWMDRAKFLRLELAADWLVMMATLAYIKSRYLLPVAKDAQPDRAQVMLEDIAVKLRRQEAVRNLVDALVHRPRLGTNWHAPGQEAVPGRENRRIESTLHALLTAYKREARHTVGLQPAPVRKPFDVLSVEQALQHLKGLELPRDRATPLLSAVPPGGRGEERITGRSRIASTYVAALGMAKAGRISVEGSADGIQVELTPRQRT
jgi:segregation and condensation protein A